jgi:hypothetical protein
MKNLASLNLGTLLMFLVAVTAGCSNEPSQPAEIASLIEIVYQTGPEISAGGSVDAVLENKSNQCIHFPVDLNTKVFVEQHGDWIEVENQITYLGDSPVLLQPKGDIWSSTLVYIQPDTSELTVTEPVDSYALVTGNLCENEDVVIEKKIPFVIIPLREFLLLAVINCSNKQG